MKIDVRTIRKSFIKKIVFVIMFGFIFLLPCLVLGQNPGDNPDARPPEVPLNGNMSVILIAGGIILAVRTLKKRSTFILRQ